VIEVMIDADLSRRIQSELWSALAALDELD